jgi:hypothetical protein
MKSPQHPFHMPPLFNKKSTMRKLTTDEDNQLENNLLAKITPH